MRQPMLALIAILATAGLTQFASSKMGGAVAQDSNAKPQEKEDTFTCPEKGHKEFYGFKPGDVLRLDAGLKAGTTIARSRTTSRGTAIRACIPVRPFIQGEYAERHRIELREAILDDSTTRIYFFIQETDLVRRRPSK